MVSQIQQALANIGEKAITSNNGTKDNTASVNEKDLYKVMVMDKIDTVMARDVNVNETIYNTIQNSFHALKCDNQIRPRQT